MTESEKKQPVDKVRQVELLISSLLRWGVLASLVVVVAGTVISFTHHPDYLSSPAELKKITSIGAEFPHSIKSVLSEVRQLRGRSLVVVGLLLLIATPVARVAVSIFAFVYEEDLVFVVITSVVLALLLLSFFLGKAG